MNNIAILLTCYNRIAKTDTCLSTFIHGMKGKNNSFHIYLVDDNSSDGTTEMIRNKYPKVNIIHGSGSLFWAGGMRLAWNTAINSKEEYDGFLLINDDVEFIDSFWDNLLFTQQWCKTNYHRDGIYVLSVKEKETDEFSYGGYQLKKKIFKHTLVLKKPTNQPQLCDMANANILYVSSETVKQIGTLDTHFTHSLADVDYTLCASEKGIPVIICPEIGGYCANDHKYDRLAYSTLKKRIKHLYDVKGYALNEYLYYLKKHFRWKAPYAFISLWTETLFPFLRKN